MLTRPRIRRYHDVDDMPIDKFVALALCEGIRLGSYRNFTFSQRCKRCMETAEDGIPGIMAEEPGNRGCKYVNRSFKKMMGEA